MKTSIALLLLCCYVFAACQKDKGQMLETNATPHLNYVDGHQDDANTYSGDYAVERIYPFQNDFVVNGSAYHVNLVGRSIKPYQQIMFRSEEAGGAMLTCSTKELFPLADGEYRYQLGNSLIDPHRMMISVTLFGSGQTFGLFQNSDVCAIVRISGRNMTLIIPEIQLDALNGSDNTILLSAVVSDPATSLNAKTLQAQTTKPTF